jgi:hypothetical protein
MGWRPSHPRDFLDARRRKPSEEELTNLIGDSKYPPLFVYGHLMLPTVLKYFVDLPQSANVDMIFATLGGYKLYHFSGETNSCRGLPTIRPSSSPYHHVEGMLIFGLTQEQRSMVSEVEGAPTGQTPLVDVQVRVSQLDTFARCQYTSQKLVDAGTFVWIKTDGWSLEGVEPMETSYWPIDEFLQGQLYENIVRYQNRSRIYKA